MLLSYVPDWMITCILAALFFLIEKVDGFQRHFSLSDTSLRHPYAVHERVPVLALYLLSIAAPLAIQSIVNLLTIRSWWDFHTSTLGLLLSLSITGSLTQLMKITVGRPRPDAIDRCQPIPGSEDPVYGLSTVSICTQTNVHIMRDCFRSFPSGHSSMSFAGLGFLAFYLAGKLHLFDRRGNVGKIWIVLAPFAGALLVAVSRTMDYRHHWQDVLVGSGLGAFVSYFSYRQYYPSLAADLCHRPWSPRIKHDSDHVLPVHFGRHPSSASVPDGGSPTGRCNDDDPSSSSGAIDGTMARRESELLAELWDRDEVAPRV